VWLRNNTALSSLMVYLIFIKVETFKIGVSPVRAAVKCFCISTCTMAERIRRCQLFRHRFVCCCSVEQCTKKPYIDGSPVLKVCPRFHQYLALGHEVFFMVHLTMPKRNKNCQVGFVGFGMECRHVI